MIEQQVVIITITGLLSFNIMPLLNVTIHFISLKLTLHFNDFES